MKYFGIKILGYESDNNGPGYRRTMKWRQKLFDKPYLEKRFNYSSYQGKPYVLKCLKIPPSHIDKEIMLMGIYYELAREKIYEYRDYA